VELSDIRVRPDVVFTGPRVAVFIDGCYWHGCTEHKALPKTNTAFWSQKISRNTERDWEVDRALANGGWLVLRFWEHEDLIDICNTVEDAVRRHVAVRPPRRKPTRKHA